MTCCAASRARSWRQHACRRMMSSCGRLGVLGRMVLPLRVGCGRAPSWVSRRLSLRMLLCAQPSARAAKPLAKSSSQLSLPYTSSVCALGLLYRVAPVSVRWGPAQRRLGRVLAQVRADVGDPSLGVGMSSARAASAVVVGFRPPRHIGSRQSRRLPSRGDLGAGLLTPRWRSIASVRLAPLAKHRFREISPGCGAIGGWLPAPSRTRAGT